MTVSEQIETSDVRNYMITSLYRNLCLSVINLQ